MFDSADSMLIEEPIEPNDAKDPIDPIDRTEPTLPIDRTEPTLPMDRSESRERMDHLDLGTAASVVARPSPIESAHCGQPRAQRHTANGCSRSEEPAPGSGRPDVVQPRRRALTRRSKAPVNACSVASRLIRAGSATDVGRRRSVTGRSMSLTTSTTRGAASR
jgi:hypothetical protein